MSWLVEFVIEVIELVTWPFEGRRKRVARERSVPDRGFGTSGSARQVLPGKVILPA